MSWRETDLVRRLGIRLPVIQAPMAGGWTTARLVADVCRAGGLGSLAGAMLPPGTLREQIRAIRALTDEPFAVNLFAPLPPPSEDRLVEWAQVSGVPLPARPGPGPRLDDQLTVIAEERVPVLSFTFGLLPELAGIEAFTIGTATTAAEALVLASAGVDAVVAQGLEAGGHRGTFATPIDESLIGTMALVPQVVDAVRMPVIASGGIMDGRGIAAALALGAQGAQLGTAFLTCPEAGIGAGFRAALSSPTTVTNVLTGRHARAVRTPLVTRLERAGISPPDYPLPRLFLTEPPFLAGQGAAMARSLPAAELVHLLEAETEAVLKRLQPGSR